MATPAQEELQETILDMRTLIQKYCVDTHIRQREPKQQDEEKFRSDDEESAKGYQPALPLGTGSTRAGFALSREDIDVNR